MKTNFLPQLQMDFSGGLGEDVSSSPMKPKTFEELFAGTGIEPTKDENGGVHYNFNATLKNKPMKLYAEEQLQEAYNRGLMDGRLNNVDYSITDGFTPIELPKPKTAMQELIDELKLIEAYPMSPLVLRIATDLLEKEKEQIIKSWEKGYSTGCVVGSNDYTNEDEEKDNGNYYYNQTYNQNK